MSEPSLAEPSSKHQPHPPPRKAWFFQLWLNLLTWYFPHLSARPQQYPPGCIQPNPVFLNKTTLNKKAQSNSAGSETHNNGQSDLESRIPREGPKTTLLP